jgi:hypothetical protein
MGQNDAIAARWAELGRMDRSALRVAWTRAFGEAPPNFLSMLIMRKALIWSEQCARFGGLQPDLRRALKAAAAGKQLPREAASTALRPGTQLIREWNGRRYLVEVAGDGYVMNGQRFASLSAVALHITGTTWSGPRFFGLTGRSGGPG